MEKFIALGKDIFRPFRNDPEIMGFWWARFQRLARWIVENEVSLRSDAAQVIAEVKGLLILKLVRLISRSVRALTALMSFFRWQGAHC